MSDTHPGVEDEVEHALRLGLATAGQLADRVARARQELARDAQRRSDDEHRQLEARFRAEGASAAARLSVVDRPEWWNHATPQQIVSMYELARQWRDDQPHAATAADTIAQQVQDRYGIDMTSPDQLRAALARAEIDRAPTDSPATARERPDDLATALVSVVQADRRDAILEVAAEETVSREQRPEATQSESRAVQEPTESGPAYDSPMRRDATAARMREAGLPEESIAVATRADIAQARPAAGAATAARSAPRSTAGRSAGRGEHRIDRSR
jgi:colicin import membrane protein